jgi:hypothetical protein
MGRALRWTLVRDRRKALPMSDEVIRRKTGRGWEEWFDLLD